MHLPPNNYSLATLHAGTMASTKSKHKQRYPKLNIDLIKSLEVTSQSFSSLRFIIYSKMGFVFIRTERASLTKETTSLPVIKPLLHSTSCSRRLKCFSKRAEQHVFQHFIFRKLLTLYSICKENLLERCFIFLLIWLQCKAAENGTL